MRQTMFRRVCLALALAGAAALLGGCAFVRPDAQHDMIQGFFGVVPVVLTGVFVGLVGTLVGAGGGFILVPILLIMYGFTPQHAIGTSTAVVFLNALSGTFAYMSQERIDYGLGVKFSVVAVPGVVIGAILSQQFNMVVFSVIFALLLMAVTYTLVFVDEFCLVCSKSQTEPTTRVVYDSTGETHTYSPDMAVGFGGSFLVGILSGLLGVGGGLMHVPLMNFIGIPIHIAAATSHFIIVITSFFGVMIFAGLKTIDLDYTVFLGIGTILGAYYGARLAMAVDSEVIKKVIAVLLLIVSVKLILGII
ncbi:sulfite exporter TauE/SafE family protein [Candidatus Magnetominusculus dajiuhuensis]|uniref:sulfite exporter TauE/SafE family protein n=1 Tax=Candidatus Magnetominusculus dajiuhuensis TaxID=3137712 RepID=UPI003B42F7F1